MNRRKRSSSAKFRKAYRRKWSGKANSGRWYRERALSLKQHDEHRFSKWDNKESI